jgi:hypothetical protein
MTTIDGMPAAEVHFEGATQNKGRLKHYAAVMLDRGAILMITGEVGRDREGEFPTLFEKMAHSLRRRDDVFESLRCK